MEKIYTLPTGELICIKKFYNDYKENLFKDELFHIKTDDEIVKCLASGEDKKFKKLADSVSIDHLQHKDDVPIFDFNPANRTHKHYIRTECPKKYLKNLKTVEEIVNFRRKNYGSPFGASALSCKFLDNQIPSDIATKENNLKPYSDVVISIRFYRPYVFRPSQTASRPRFSEEFYVLGSNYLSELKDKISCISNRVCLKDISENPYQELKLIDKDPGFFFIKNVFYNDTRDPENPDYSKVIREWWKNRKHDDVTELNVAKMEETKFIDLTVLLGFPQVFQHHGNCEHLFTFSSIRMLQPDDILIKEKYPLLKCLAFPNSKTCHICGGREFTFIVTESKRQFHDPCFVCRKCFDLFFYVDGKKVENFKAYRFIDVLEEDEEVVPDIPEMELDKDSNIETETNSEMELSDN